MTVVKQVAANVQQDTGSCSVLTDLGYYLDSKHLHSQVAADNI